MKLKCIIIGVVFCSILALILQLVGLILKYWMYAPSIVQLVDGKNVTFYAVRGLWQSENEIVKYKVEGNDTILDAGKTFETQSFKPADLGAWFQAVRVLEVIGATINLAAMIAAIGWYASAQKCGFKSKCNSHLFILPALIFSGIMDLLGVTIMIGMIELSSWAGTLSGIAGTVCIIGAAFIRYWQQEEYALTQ